MRMKDIAVKYLGGSGFMLAMGETGMLFDASDITKNSADQRVLPTRRELAAFERLYVFVSHRHEEHFSPVIYDLCGERAHYILGFDVPQPYRGTRMAVGDEMDLGPVHVRAFGSTDEGVSFLVNYTGITLFHAGDLNLWHWRDESTTAQVEAAEAAFYECVAPIPQQAIDVAFFPVDPRQGSMYDAGAGYFIMTVKPRVLIPMHFQGRGDVAMLFSVNAKTQYTQVVAIQSAGEQVDLHIPESENSAPDQKLKDLLEDEHFGE